jgi:outer membrane immunogenic protein
MPDLNDAPCCLVDTPAIAGAKQRPFFIGSLMTRVLPPFFLCLALVSAPAAAQIMTGPRVEATMGYDRLSSHDDFDDLPDTFDGARLGGAVGYDVAASSNLTLGVEGSAAWTLGARKTTLLAHDRLHQDLGRDLDLMVRLGYRVSPTILGYAKAGYANSRVDIQYEARIIGGFETIRSHADRGGIRLGAGLEKTIQGPVYAKAEYRWTAYQTDAPYMQDVGRNQFLIGFGTRF